MERRVICFYSKGQEVRRLVSNTHVIKELLKHMSSMPGHHDPSAGFGNVIPFRLLKYGSQTFLREVYAILGDQSSGRLTNNTVVPSAAQAVILMVL